MTRAPGEIVRLETARFVLRSVTREDVDEAFLSWMADPEVMLGLNMPPQRPTRLQMVHYALSHDNHTRFMLIIEPRNAAAIGFFTVTLVPVHGVAETAVVVGDRRWWGKDVVIEARSAILNFVFDELGAEKVMGRPHGRNVASIFNYRALGFTCEAVLRQQMRAVGEGGRLDQLVFGLMRDEWLARRGTS